MEYRIVCTITGLGQIHDNYVPVDGDKIITTAKGKLKETTVEVPPPVWEGTLTSDNDFPADVDRNIDMPDTSTWFECSDREVEDGDTVVQYFLKKKVGDDWQLVTKLKPGN